MGVTMDLCLFTVEHPSAKRIYMRGVADITEPIDDYVRIVQFYHGEEWFSLKNGLPPNPYDDGTEEFQLFNELISNIRKNWIDFGDDLVFVTNDEQYLEFNRKKTDYYTLNMEKVII